MNRLYLKILGPVQGDSEIFLRKWYILVIHYTNYSS